MTTHLPSQRFYATSQLSDHRSLTPEGFLLIRDVPVARTGAMMYAASELPKVKAGPDGLIRVDREDEDVFRPETLASFNGKPLTNDHPPVGMLDSRTWRSYALGTVIDPRRGDAKDGFDPSFMYADVLVQDQSAIRAIEAGKKEVSAGYDAEYEEIAPGHARQRNIVGNHVALVDRGRCGPLCAVGDSDMPNRVRALAQRLNRAWATRDRSAFTDAVVEAAEHNPDQLGEILSGVEMEKMGEPEEGTRVTVNLNGVGDRSTRDEEPPPADPGAGGDMGQQLAELEGRVQNLEEFIQALAEEADPDGDGNIEPGGQPDEDRAGFGDRRTRDARGRGRDAAPAGTEGEEDEPTEDRRTRDQGSGYREDMIPGEARGDAPSNRGTGDRRAAVGDSTSMRDAFVSMLSRAETLVPGIGLPTFDSAATARHTFDSMCAFKRKTLDAAYKNAERRAVIDSLLEGRKADFYDRSMTCDAVATVFSGAAAIVAAASPFARSPVGGASGRNNGFSTKVPSPAELNQANRAAFAR